MSKPNRKRYNLAAVKQKTQEAVGAEIEFEGADGQTYAFPHPLFWDEEIKAAMGEIGDGEASGAEQARVLLGDEQYQRFVEAGEDPADLNLLIIEVQRHMRDYVQGRPTR